MKILLVLKHKLVPMESRQSLKECLLVLPSRVYHFSRNTVIIKLLILMKLTNCAMMIVQTVMKMTMFRSLANSTQIKRSSQKSPQAKSRQKVLTKQLLQVKTKLIPQAVQSLQPKAVKILQAKRAKILQAAQLLQAKAVKVQLLQAKVIKIAKATQLLQAKPVKIFQKVPPPQAKAVKISQAT
jgi:hypothetical protein